MRGELPGMTLDELSDYLLGDRAMRYETAERNMFALGVSFEQIAEGVAVIRAIDERIAANIRDAILRLRSMEPEAICQHVRGIIADTLRLLEPGAV
jgi:hypothetical protein